MSNQRLERDQRFQARQQRQDRENLKINASAPPYSSLELNIPPPPPIPSGNRAKETKSILENSKEDFLRELKEAVESKKNREI